MAFVYGDTAGTLRDGEVGLAQTLVGDDDGYNILVGDAEAITDTATGGNDTITGGNNVGYYTYNEIYGDALEMSGRAVGGDDSITSGDALVLGDLVFSAVYGDAYSMGDRAVGGDDTISAGGFFSGGAVASGDYDDLYGDAHDMSAHAVGGDDILVGGILMRGDAVVMTGRAVGGDDTLLGAENDKYTTMAGDADTLSGHAEGGDDRIDARGVSNSSYGDAYEMSGSAVGGDDTLIAVANGALDYMAGDALVATGAVTFGDDRLVGNSRPGFHSLETPNLMVGDCGALQISGAEHVRGGDDTLVGGAVDDEMWGDWQSATADARGGHDMFVFRSRNAGTDVIHDFHHHEDKIGLQLDSAGLAALLQTDVSVIGGNTVISLGFDGSLTIEGIDDLQADDFVLLG